MKDLLLLKLTLIRWWLSEKHTAAVMWAAWHLVPRKLAYWILVRGMAHASQVYAGELEEGMEAITPVMVLKAWDEFAERDTL